MSQWKRKLKTNDVSAPIKVEHVSHIGHQDVQVSKENFTPAPPALCSGPDINQESKVLYCKMSYMFFFLFRQNLAGLYNDIRAHS